MPLPGNLLDPIPGPTPCGENLYYSPLYDKIKEARRQDEEIPQGEWRLEFKKADYVQVIKLTTEALSKKSKDLQLAAWLSEALLKQEGFGAFADGLDLMRGLAETYWDGLYPEIEDGDAELRATPLEWVGTRLGEAVERAPLTRSGLNWLVYKDSRRVPYESEAQSSEVKAKARETALSEGKLSPEEVDAAVDGTPTEFYTTLQADLARTLESLAALGQLCDEKFGDVAPSFGPLRGTLEEYQQLIRILLSKRGALDAAEESAPAAEAAAWEAPAAGQPAVRAPAASVGGGQSAEPADQEDAFRRVAAVARFLRKESPYSPVSYLLLRGLRWGELRVNGSSIDESLLDAPPTEVRQQLKRLAGEGQWEEVLETAETAMASACGRGWLDLQRYAVRACENLGSWYDPIALALRAEVKALLQDFPLLRAATMADDTPTANPETQAWLDEIITAPAAEPEVPAGPAQAVPRPEPGSTVADVYDVAMDAVRAKRPQEAIELLGQEIGKVNSGRLRFQRKLQLAQICMASGHEAIAHPILEEIGREIEQRNLEEWETPEMLAQALVLLLRCLNKVNGSPEQRQAVYARICRLDPLQALSCSK